ncbi:hypothetical protein PTKIN_Ptkin09bG0282600 [Pterospermum kingtungense]
MAKALITAAVKVALSKAISIIEQQFNFLGWGLKDELNKLRSSLILTRTFLQDAERKQVDEAIKVWLQQLRDVAYKADDVLDELAYEDIRRRKVDGQISKKVSNFFSLSKNPIVFLLKMVKKVKKIKRSMDEINLEASKFGLQGGVQNAFSSGVGGTHSFCDSSRVVGREADGVKIVELEGLETHSNLKSLTIENYRGEYYPSCLVRKSGSPSASFQPINLVELNLLRCVNLKNLPTLGQYPNLKFLDVCVLPNVRRIGNEFYMNNTGDSVDKNKAITLFPALEKFTLSNMEEVKEWLDVEPTVPMFPSLKVLDIECCGKLSSVPVMTRFSSLESLSIYFCEELSLIGDELFPSSLKKLEIAGCRNLSSISRVEGGISFLQDLRVGDCDNLSKIEDGLLASTCLRDVCVEGCPNLTSIHLNSGSESLVKLQLTKCDKLQEIEGGLSGCTRLEKLWIEDCPNLTSIPSIDGFSSLLKLRLHKCEGLISLPSGLRACTSLEDLRISECTNLKSIPEESLGCLTRLKKLVLGGFSEEVEEFPGLNSIHRLNSSLEDLTLVGWEKLSSLPHQLQHLSALKRLTIQRFSGVKSLPEWLGNFSSLRYLHIWQCDQLSHLPSKKAMQRLSNLELHIWNSRGLWGNDAERSKISHIPYIDIY